MTEPHDPDPLTDLLALPPADAGALRQAVLTATTRRLRQRRSAAPWSLAGRAGRLLCRRAIELAADLPGNFRPGHTSPGREAASAGRSPAGGRPAPELLAPPEQVPENATALRQAGDRYLTEAADPEAALHCYSKSLDAGTEDDTKFSPDDNWLLMAIKNAREKEARHAN